MTGRLKGKASCPCHSCAQKQLKSSDAECRRLAVAGWYLLSATLAWCACSPCLSLFLSWCPRSPTHRHSSKKPCAGQLSQNRGPQSPRAISAKTVPGSGSRCPAESEKKARCLLQAFARARAARVPTGCRDLLYASISRKCTRTLRERALRAVERGARASSVRYEDV